MLSQKTLKKFADRHRKEKLAREEAEEQIYLQEMPHLLRSIMEVKESPIKPLPGVILPRATNIEFLTREQLDQFQLRFAKLATVCERKDTNTPKIYLEEDLKRYELDHHTMDPAVVRDPFKLVLEGFPINFARYFERGMRELVFIKKRNVDTNLLGNEVLAKSALDVSLDRIIDRDYHLFDVFADRGVAQAYKANMEGYQASIEMNMEALGRLKPEDLVKKIETELLTDLLLL